MEISKDYNPLEVEPKWQKKWLEEKIYAFRKDDFKSPTYVIDTPPPYPSGEFHMGTALNWTYMDIVARYKRMQGFNVFFPQGWDCHGLPTEVQVEKKYGIKKGDLPPEKFRELCIQLTEENIAHMREEMRSLGFSIDWSTEYRTMDPSYYSKTQLSFVRLYKKGLIYRGEHPVNWCPRCETAIADAEVEYSERETFLNYLKFELDDGEKITIATTRPEFLPACVAVAVHPADERYRKHVGKKVKVPPMGQVVGIMEDAEVDPNFGTGVVMICTFGDKTDVKWVKKHKLPVVKLIDERGRMTASAGKYRGLSIMEARKAILEDLEKAGVLERSERLEQSVGVCWRCKTPVEILSVPQWFMRVLDLNERVVEEAEKVRWVPPHMGSRLKDWAKSMDWDWVISRQRIFATPIPVWYCSSCKEPMVAEEEELPVIPWKDAPKRNCPRCGGNKFEPERDVLDTWMDSSITIAVHAGWPEIDSRLYPADLQPNGTDIIRTWDYYLMVRHLALLGSAPYKTVMINGMVVGSDGKKMSKSLGNYVDTTFARKKFGADALRQWAVLGATTGSDVPFSWKEVEFGYKFMRKLWNAVRFAAPYMAGGLDIKKLELSPLDRWILSKLNRLVREVTSALEDFNFNLALKKIQAFVWHDFCDMYIEGVKYRLYGGENADPARATLREAIFTVIRLLAPFIPHFAEEVYQSCFAEGKEKSVHLLSWPKADESLIDEEAEKAGEVINTVVGALRNFKSERRIALSQEISRAIICCPDERLRGIISSGVRDIAGTIRIMKTEVCGQLPDLLEKIKGVSLNYSRVGPKFRKDVKLLEEGLRRMSREEISEKLRSGRLALEIGGKEFLLESEDLVFIRETEISGRKVEKVDVGNLPITVIVEL
ncbi:MAG: valine--tRNA ligase [Candidatus Hadarchaeales archaeon]